MGVLRLPGDHSLAQETMLVRPPTIIELIGEIDSEQHELEYAAFDRSVKGRSPLWGRGHQG